MPTVNRRVSVPWVYYFVTLNIQFIFWKQKRYIQAFATMCDKPHDRGELRRKVKHILNMFWFLIVV